MEAKQLIASSAAGNDTTKTTELQLLPPALARDVISFHYVSTVESRLLYRLLDAQLQTSPILRTAVKIAAVKGNTTTSAFPALCLGQEEAAAAALLAGDSVPCLSAHDIYRMWPRSDEQVGHYSRPLAKGAAGEKQAAVLHAYLTQIRIEKQPQC